VADGAFAAIAGGGAGQCRSVDQLTFIGTATTLLRLGPFTLLTDPNFLHRGEYAYLGYGLVSKRLTEPALSPSELPDLDGIVLSHLHGDHWDRRADEGLDHTLPVVTTPKAADRLRRRHGFGNAVGLSTWQQHRFARDGASLTVTSVPGTHSTNSVLKALLPPVMGSVLELRSGDAGDVTRRIYLTGDTMPFDDLGRINDLGPVDTTVIHIGGTTLPGGFTVTMTGKDAVRCLQLVRTRVAIPVHYNDYGRFKEPLDAARRALDAADLDAEIHYITHGQTLPL
jgi:L-ascorbate metabolism protein UlaG (beta-lactamase superfamily)